jgi:hypothetical protein
MPVAEQIEERLWLAARDRAAQNHIEIAPGSADHLREFIHGGVETLVAKGHSPDETEIALAEANIIAFTTKMIIEARTLNLTELHEPAFFAARSALCPIWPFC